MRIGLLTLFYLKSIILKSKLNKYSIFISYMKNKEFFYQQYNKINWQNQDKTKINSLMNSFIIKKIISKKDINNIKIFDMGFGIGFFFEMLAKLLPKQMTDIVLEGCEPSLKNYKYFKSKTPNLERGQLQTYNKTFLETKTDTKFDFITSIYVFPHIEHDELNKVIKKIHTMLNKDGQFILVVANEEDVKKRLKAKGDLFIEKNKIKFDGKEYEEVLHYSNIPEIGTIIDYNREEYYR